MADATAIEWTDSTWNPIRGCSRVSEGCRHCYAEGVAHRFSGPGQAYEGLVRIGADGQRRREWNGQIRFVEEHLLDPLRWGPVRRACENCRTFGWPDGKRLNRCDPKLLSCTGQTTRGRRIFVNSMSDLFHENVTDEQRDRIFAVMALCPQHTFQVLTKRPERMQEYLSSLYSSKDRRRRLAQRAERIQPGSAATPTWLREHAYQPGSDWSPVLQNVQHGVSGENQETAIRRSWILLQTPAAVRFLSAEPMLGAIDLDAGELVCKTWRQGATIGTYLDWVICGGESGAGARPMHPDWARSLRDQCQAAGVPFFFKQWGEWAETTAPTEVFNKSAGDFETVPAGAGMKRVGKKAAGHLLDGVEWHQFPEARS